jgi:hypothetical protein
LNFQDLATNRATAISLCVVTPTPRRLATRSRSRPGARAIGCPAGILGSAPVDALGVKQELEKALAQDGKPTK